MNESNIQRVLYYKYRKRSRIIVPNCYIGRFECDMLRVMYSNYSIEYEIKLSKADFKADLRKKGKHKMLSKGMRVNKFYYVCPAEMLSVGDVNDIDSRYGLIYVARRNLRIVQPAQMLGKGRVDDNSMLKLYRKLYFRFWTQKLKTG